MTELSTFDFQGATRLGKELRHRCAGDVAQKDVAEALLDAVDSLEHQGAKAFVRTQAFVTRKLGELPDALQAQVRASAPALCPDTPCLMLVATRGVQPRWNDAEPSELHRTVLRTCDAAPMVAEFVRQLGTGENEQPPEGSFHVADASVIPAVREQDFVTAHAVRSVIGFGATPFRGESLVVIAFSRAFVDRATARTFATLALYAKLAWLEARESRAILSESQRSGARAAAFEELVRSHETHLHELALESSRRLAAVHAEAQRVADASAQKLDAQNTYLRRTQRAMLNVIEDLREARAALAEKVQERTRELAETNAELAARNRELEEFVYIASHDLQEPLRTVSGYLQMIERRYRSKLSDEADEFIRFSIDGAQRMQALIESLLLYSRVTKKDRVFESVSLDEVFDIALSNLAARIEETAASIDRSPLPQIQADRMQMIQLFQNLLSNALKFAGAKPPRIHITSEHRDGVCSISVRDEGIGFNPKYAERIFQVFRRLRRDTPGTGIGLSICKKIVERHRGRIEAHSTPGEGSTFTVHLAENSLLRGTS